MPGKSPSIEQVLMLLTEASPRLEALTAGLAPEQLRAASDGEWSATDVLAHLRACADVWGGCIAAILADERPTLRAVNPRTWIKQTDYRELEFRPSLQAFAAQRAALLAVLEPLPPAALVADGDGDGGGHAPRADRVLLRAVVNKTRTAAPQADRPPRRHDAPRVAPSPA